VSKRSSPLISTNMNSCLQAFVREPSPPPDEEIMALAMMPFSSPKDLTEPLEKWKCRRNPTSVIAEKPWRNCWNISRSKGKEGMRERGKEEFSVSVYLL